jgi:hypothetical protein
MNKIDRVVGGIWCVLAVFTIFSSCEQPSGPGSTFAPLPDLRPAAPDAPRVTAGDSLITVTWNPVENVDGYELYLNGNTIPPAAPSLTVSGSITVSVFDGLPNKTPQYVWLKTKNAFGSSDFSPYAKGTPWPSDEAPETPSAPTITAGMDQLTAQWDAAGGASEYEVYVSTTPNPPSKPVLTTSNTSGTIYSLQNETMYIWIKAVNAAGSSGFSPIATGIPKIPDAVPGVPAKPVLAAGNQTITVSWATVDKASAYEVWINTSADSAAATKNTEVSGAVLQTIISG